MRVSFNYKSTRRVECRPLSFLSLALVILMAMAMLMTVLVSVAMPIRTLMVVAAARGSMMCRLLNMLG